MPRRVDPVGVFIYKSAMDGETRTIEVVAGVLHRGAQVMLARRGEGQRHAGKWEFPGGKIESGESHREALIRELNEEFGIRCVPGEFVVESRHEYPDFSIVLSAFHIAFFVGNLDLRRHSEIAWVDPLDLLSYDLSGADVAIAQALRSARSTD